MAFRDLGDKKYHHSQTRNYMVRIIQWSLPYRVLKDTDSSVVRYNITAISKQKLLNFIKLIVSSPIKF